MVDKKFDEFAKALADEKARRQMLRWLGGLMGGAMLGPFASASHKPGHGGNTSAACNSFCNRNTTRNADRQNCLAACQQCSGVTDRICGQRGAMTCCAGGTTCCNGACVNPSSSTSHCGSCGNACPAGQSCVSGQCQLVCPTGQTVCGTTCVNVTSDVDNCGDCGNACPEGYECYLGTCSTNAVICRCGSGGNIISSDGYCFRCTPEGANPYCDAQCGTVGQTNYGAICTTRTYCATVSQ